jgi:hypothetical protein
MPGSHHCPNAFEEKKGIYETQWRFPVKSAEGFANPGIGSQNREYRELQAKAE